MQKSIKKVIAGAIAALMITSSMPVVASAAVGDYEPDVQLQFSTFCDDPTDPTTIAKASQTVSYSSSGLAAYPLQWDQTAGTLTAKKEDMTSYMRFFDSEADEVEEDVVLSEGSLFAVTIRFDNVTEAASGNVNIRFSDNLTPAGYYKFKKSGKWNYGFATETNAPTSSNSYAEVAGFRGTVPDWSASTLYEGMNDTVLGDFSCIQEDPNAADGDGWSDLMMSATLVCDGDSVDVSSISSENGFFDIVEGKLNGDPEDEIIGYTYDNQFIVATFVFELTDDTKPIQFALQDPTGEFDSELNNACFFAKKSEGLAKENATTYAPNGDNAGSMKMTFLGKNENKGEAPHEHSYTAVVTAPTCTAQGYTTYTCACGDSYVADYTDMIPHTPKAAVVENEVAATCTAEGSYDEVVYCSVCNAEISRETKTTEKAAHTPKAAVVENEVAATCTAEGSYDEVVYCSVCNAEISRETKTTEKAAHTPKAAVEENRVEPTEESEGSYDEVVYCSVCNAEISREHKTIPALEHTHKYTAVVTAPTCTAKGYTTYTCACGDSYVADYTDMIPHTPKAAVVENEVAATCTAKGSYDNVVYCSVCNAEISRETVETDKAAHTPKAAVVENEVAATCTAKGSYDSVVYCSVCNAEISRETVETDKAAHTPKAAVVENEVAATCTAKGSYDSVVYCSVCNAELSRETVETDKAAHTPKAAVDENVVPATKKDAGTKDVVVYCSVCNAELSRETVETEPALGVTVTLNKSDIGIVEGLEEGANKLAYGADITLTATPVEGAAFVGWEIGGNIVSKNATYTTKAAYDFTITPVFEDLAAATITVTFYDKYGNTIKQYKDMDVADYQAAIAAEFDGIVAPTYPSYTFAGWDKSKDEILAIDASTTIWATYAKVEETVVPKYTVTTNADLILPDGIVNGQIPYDTKVTVRDTAATAWKVGDAVVAYGTEYSFYVGSDVTIDPVYAVVEEKTTTTVIGANLVAGSDYKYNIVATRNVPDNCTLVDYGFVYGKNLTDTELNLDFVGQKGTQPNAGDIKAVHAGTRNTESNEFAFNYGIKAKNAPVTAKSFVVVINKDGETEIIYSDMFTQNY